MAGGCPAKAPDLGIGVKWHPPRRPYYKLNTNGATYQKERMGGIGGLIRNINGD